MFKIVPNRNVGFTLPGGLTATTKHLKKTSHKTLKVLFILAGLIPFLFTKSAIAQFKIAVIQKTAVAVATQTTTDDAIQKRIEELIAQLGDKRANVRISAADALGQIGDPQGVRALRKRALARKAREVLLAVSKLLVLCALLFLSIVGLVRLLKSQRQNIIRFRRYMQYKTEAGDRKTRAIFIYLAIVFVNAICPLQLVRLGFAPFCGLLGLLGFHWLIITTGGFLVLVHEYNLWGPDGGLGLFYLLSLAYSVVFFLPLFGALYFKEKTDKNRFKVVQVIFTICHVAVIFILIALYDLGNRMVDIIRY